MALGRVLWQYRLLVWTFPEKFGKQLPMKKYVTLENYATPAGLGHQLYNLLCLLNYSYNRKQVLILPLFRLAARHNHGRELQSNLSDYYDYDGLTINLEKYPVQHSASGVSESQIEPIEIDRDALKAAGFLFGPSDRALQ